MAFPVIQTTAENSVNTAGTSHAITLPADIRTGDGILIILDKGSTSGTFNSKAGWTELVDENLGNGITIWYRDSDGTEGASVTFTHTTSTRSASISYRISGHQPFAIRSPELSTVATGTSTDPGPSILTPTGGAKDYLWIAMAGMAGEELDDDTWGNTPPTNYLPSPPTQKACGTAGTNLGGKILTATRSLNAANETPGTFNTDVSTAWRSYTIAIHPAISTWTVGNSESISAPKPPAPIIPRRQALETAEVFIPAISNAITIDEIVPRMAAAITSIIAVSGWVFAGTPTPPSFVNHGSPAPPRRPIAPIIRPVEDVFYRFANSQQSSIATEVPVRPQTVAKPVLRPRTDDFIASPVVGTTPDYGWWTPPAIPPRVRLKQPTIAPVWDYGATPVTPPVFIGELIPYVLQGVSSVIVVPASVFIPAVASPATYPIALEDPRRPQAKRPPAPVRTGQTGTVGVFFYQETYDYGWEEKARPRLAPRPLIRPFDAVHLAPAVVAYPAGLDVPRRPETIARSIRRAFDHAHIPWSGVIPDYGWTDPAARPRAKGPRLPRFEADSFIAPAIAATYDYGWKQEQRLPIARQPSNIRFLPPDVHIPTIGSTYDFGWKNDPRPQPFRARNCGLTLAADFVLVQARTYAFWDEPAAPPRPNLRRMAQQGCDVFIATAPQFSHWTEPIVPEAVRRVLRFIAPREIIILIPPSLIGAWTDQPLRPQYRRQPFRVPQTDWFMIILPPLIPPLGQVNHPGEISRTVVREAVSSTPQFGAISRTVIREVLDTD